MYLVSFNFFFLLSLCCCNVLILSILLNQVAHFYSMIFLTFIEFLLLLLFFIYIYKYITSGILCTVESAFEQVLLPGDTAHNICFTLL